MKRFLIPLPVFSALACLGCLVLLTVTIITASGDSQPRIVDPGDMGFSTSKLQEIEAHMQGYVDRNSVAGMITFIARKGQIVHFQKYGFRNIEEQQQMEFDTIFRLASMTKPISAVALLMLQEQGLVDLEAPVSNYLPEFADTRVFAGAGETVALQRPISVKDALLHTTGLTAAPFGRSPVHEMYRGASLTEARTLEEYVAELAKLPLLHQPGAEWTYGVSTDLAARIVEIVSGLPFEQFVSERILHPLKMKDTGFSVPQRKLGRLATLYSATDDGLQAIPMPSSPSFPRGVSGLNGTTTDYFRFAQMLLNGGVLDGVRILQPETVALMTRNHLPPDIIPIGVMGLKMGNNGHGLGLSVVVDDEDVAPQPNGFWWNRGAPPVGSFWWVGAHQTYFWVDPTNEIIGMVMAQAAELMPYAYKQEFHTMVYEAFQGDKAETGGSR